MAQFNLTTEEKIQLGNEVMVSDPCYSIPTWCQKIVKDVLPGNYKPYCRKSDLGGWGVRNSTLLVVHEDYIGKELTWRKDYTADIGVDSGQAGIFSMESYRKDDIAENIKTDYNNFTLGGRDVEGDKWYEKMCQFTLRDSGWGSYDGGVVSSSGVGDGSYQLLVAKEKGKVVGLAINFGIENYPNYFLNHIKDNK